MKKVKVVMLTVAILLVGGVAFAQNYPTKPVRMIVPWPPGGASDLVGRIVAAGLTKELGQQVVVDNRSGGNGNVGVELAARAPADGYTLLQGNNGAMAINPALYPKFPINPVRDFIGVTEVVDVPTAMVVNSSVPVKTVKEFIEYAKARPGKLNFGSAGQGTTGYLEMENFKRVAGINLLHVPYNGAAPAVIGLLGNEVQCSFVTLAAVMAHVKTGKIKVLGVAALQRLESVPDVPTMPELGYATMKSGSWQGIYVPAGTPKPVVAKLYAAAIKALSDPETIKRLNSSGVEVVTSKSPEEFAVFMKEENEKWAKLVKETGVVIGQ